jgi:hypothetical protein
MKEKKQMQHRKMYIAANISLVMLLGFVLVVASCKKSSPQASKPQTAPAPKAETQAPKPVAKPDANVAAVPKPAVVQPDVNTAPAAPKPAAAQPDTNAVAVQPKPAGDVEPIPLVLPKPRFTGTPERIQSITNLEKPLGRARDPFYAPKGTTNVAIGKPVTSSDEQPIIGEIKMITDGDKEATDGSYVELGPGKQYITIDLGAPHNIYAIVMWHYHKQPRAYKDVIVQVADDPDFITNVRTVFNDDDDNSSGLGIGSDKSYVETAEGKLIDARGVVARYVRCYSNGNSSNDMNNYTEVEVFGTPAK